MEALEIEKHIENLVPEKEIDKEKLRDSIGFLAEEMLKGEQLDIEIRHHFADGIYGREMIMPKGSVVVGKIHKYENLSVLSKGEVTVVSIDGVKKYKAPCHVVASPGVQRVLYAHEEVHWTVFHPTKETELEKIEEHFIAKDYSEIESLNDGLVKLAKEGK